MQELRGYILRRTLLLLPTFFLMGASPQSFVFSGTVIKPDGYPLEASSVAFTVEIRSPGPENCLLYTESHLRNMSNSDGRFSLEVGSATADRTGGAGPEYSTSLSETFDNTHSGFSGHSCDIGNVYSPSPGHTRKLKLIFDDGTSIHSLDKMVSIQSVPYAEHAYALGGKSVDELLQVEDSSNLTQANVETVFSNFTELQAILNGTSTQYALRSMNGAGQLPSFASASPPATPAAGDIWYDTDSGFIKYYNGTSTETVGTTASTGTVTDITVGAGLVDGAGNPGTTITTSGTIALPTVGTAGTYSKVTTDAYGRVTAGSALTESDIPALTSAGNGIDAGAITGGTIGGATAINTSGNLTTSGTVTGSAFSGRSYVLWDSDDTNSITINPPATGTLTSNYTLVLPPTAGTAGYALVTDGSGILSWVDISKGAGDYTASDITNVAAGNIAATDVQAAINELDTEKQPVSIELTGLSGLSTNGVIERTGAGTYATIGKGGALNQIPQVKTALTTDALVHWNNTAGGLEPFVCAIGEYLQYNGTSWVCVNSATDTAAFHNGGDSFGALTSLGTNDANDLAIKTNNIERLRILSNGNIGVGTATPTNKFHVDGSLGASGNVTFNSVLRINNGSAALPAITTYNDTKTGMFFITPGGVGSLGFSTNSGEAMRIDSTGKVGIGTAAPNEKLTVEGAISLDNLAVDPAGTANYGAIYTRTDGKLYYRNGTGTITDLTGFGSGNFMADGSVPMTGPLRLPDGSAAAPALTFTSDTNTGIFRSAADTLDFSTGGTRRLQIQSDGAIDLNVGSGSSFNVGVGTFKYRTNQGFPDIGVSSPGGNVPFNISADDNSNGTGDNPRLQLRYNGSTVGGSFSYNSDDGLLRLNQGDQSLSHLTINNSGRVGLGTTSADTRLDVEGTITSGPKGTAAGDGGAIRFEELAANATVPGTPEYVGFRAPDAITSNVIWQLPATDGGAGDLLSTDGAGALSWTSAGGVGDFKADGSVPMTGSLRLPAGAQATPSLTFTGDTNTGVFNPAADNLAFSTAGSERLRITDTGTVGIGTSSPATALHVAGQILGDQINSPQYYVGGSTGLISSGSNLQIGTGGLWTDTSIHVGSSGEVARFKSSGNMGIGTSNPASKLHLSGGNFQIGESTMTSTNPTLTLYGYDSAATTARYGRLQVETDGSFKISAEDSYLALTSASYIQSHQAHNFLGSILFAGDVDLFRHAADYLRTNDNFLVGGNVGIGTTTPSAKLEVAGQVKITGGTPGVGKILTSDATGLASWQDPVGTGDFMADGSVPMTGVLRGVGGSSAAPGYSFASDLNTGIYSPAGDNVAVTTGGTERLRVDASGNIGIGISTPDFPLQITSNVTNVAQRGVQSEVFPTISANGSYNGFGGVFKYLPSIGAGVSDTGTSTGFWTTAMRNTVVGADDDGTLTNMRGLTVQYGHNNVEVAEAPQTTNAYGVSVSPYAETGTITNAFDYYASNTVPGGTITNHYGLYILGNEKKNYLGGRLGVGQVTPAAKLHVQAETGNVTGIQVDGKSSSDSGHDLYVLRSSSSSTAGSGPNLRLDDGTTNNSIMIQNSMGKFDIWNYSAGYWLQRFTINQSGFVGIGTSIPTAELDVRGTTPVLIVKDSDTPSTSTSAYGSFTLQGSNSVDLASFRVPVGNNHLYITNNINGNIQYYLGGDSSPKVTFNSNGNVGIGTTTASERLHVVGNARFQGTVTDCTLGNGSGGTNCSSDRRLKSEITPIQNPLDKILALNGVEFRWNKKSRSPGKTDIGVIAQEVEEQFPTTVIEGEDGYKRVDYGALVAPLIEAIKELWSNSVEDRDRLEAVHREVDKLREDSQQLKQTRAELHALQQEHGELKEKFNALLKRVESLEK